MSSLRSMYSTSESSEEKEEEWSINWSLALIDEPINDLIYKSTNQRRIEKKDANLADIVLTMAPPPSKKWMNWLGPSDGQNPPARIPPHHPGPQPRRRRDLGGYGSSRGAASLPRRRPSA
jgi:hypothetical protein